MLLRDFTLAFAQGNEEFIISNMADNIHWEMVGEKVIEGKEAATAMVKESLDGSITELVLDYVFTHGRAGCVQGLMTFNTGKTFSFCDVYEFSSLGRDAKIKNIISYVVEMKV